MSSLPASFMTHCTGRSDAAQKSALPAELRIGTCASELLAAYFMNAHQEDVEQMLNLFGVDHEEGVLGEEIPEQPDEKKLTEAVKEFRSGDKAVIRNVLLKAFAAQSAIEWPALDAMLFEEAETAGGKK